MVLHIFAFAVDKLFFSFLDGEEVVSFVVSLTSMLLELDSPLLLSSSLLSSLFLLSLLGRTFWSVGVTTGTRITSGSTLGVAFLRVALVDARCCEGGGTMRLL